VEDKFAKILVFSQDQSIFVTRAINHLFVNHIWGEFGDVCNIMSCPAQVLDQLRGHTLVS